MSSRYRTRAASAWNSCTDTDEDGGCCCVQAAGSAQAKAMNHSERVLHIETSDKRARSVAEPTGCRGAQYTAPARGNVELATARNAGSAAMDAAIAPTTAYRTSS